MKKPYKFFKTIPMKIYVLIAAVFTFVFFSNDFGLVDIQKTAIIIAAGVDRTEQGFHLTAQIGKPKGSERSSCGTASVDVEGDGETISECIAEIYSKTGWVPKLIFCDTILVGEETAKDDIMGALGYFLRTEYMPDSCSVAVCKGTARDMLKSVSAIEDTTSAALNKLFSNAAEKSGKVMKQSLKEFAIDYYGASESSFLPYITSESQDCGGESGGGEGPSSSNGGAAGGQSSSGGESEKPDKKIFKAEHTALFSQGSMTAVLEPQQTFTFSLLKGKVEAGTFAVDDHGEPVNVSVLKDKGNANLKVENKPQVTLSVNLKVYLFDRGVSSPIEDVARKELSKEAIEKSTQLISEQITELWNTCVEANCDLFHLSRSLYRSSPKKYAEWKELLLSTADLKVEAKVETMK
ncbi:MAG: hypothetical protein K2N84_05335 [Clostridia bacterium]|nr:hypothetical protein [Clostridia bacterium]